MRVKVFIIAIIALFLPFVSWGEPGYDNASIAEAVVQEINAFRSNPISFADQQSILSEVQAKWGGNFAIRENLRPVVLDDALSALAADRLNMLLQGKELPDLLKQVKQALGLGKAYALEVLSYIAFANYIPPQEAVIYMLKSMEKKALLMEDAQSVPLVFPTFNRVGVAFTIAKLSINDSPMNVYVLYMVFVDDAKEGSYMEGRNCPDMRVYREPDLRPVKVLTFPDGSFFISMPPGSYLFVIKDAAFSIEISSPLILIF